MLICWQWSFLWEYIASVIKFSSGRFFGSKMEFLVRNIVGRNTQEAGLWTEHSRASRIPSTWLNYGANSSSAIWLLLAWSCSFLAILLQRPFPVLPPAPPRSRKCKSTGWKHLPASQLYLPGSIPEQVFASSWRCTERQPHHKQLLSPMQQDLVRPHLESCI